MDNSTITIPRPRLEGRERTKRHRDKLKAAGLCRTCPQRLTDALSRECESCKTRRREKRAHRKEIAAKNGLCSYCGKAETGNAKMCPECRTSQRERTAKRAEKLSNQGLCIMCGGAEILPALIERPLLSRLCESCYLKHTAHDCVRSRKAWRILKEKLAQQGYRCAYTGTPLVLGVNDSVDHVFPQSRFPHMANAASNIQWVTRDVNSMKRHHLHDEFLALVKAIASHCHL